MVWLWVSLVGILLSVLYLVSLEPRISLVAPGSPLMFDSIAEKYDLGNQILSLGMHKTWKTLLLHDLLVNNSTSLLDLATGTGDVAVLARTDFHAPFVMGLDPSEGMIAQAKLKTRGISDILIGLGDARNLSSIPDCAYDRVSMSFGIRNVQGKDLALREMSRVVKDDGLVGIMEFVSPDERTLLGFVAAIFLKSAVPFLGYLASGTGPEYHYLKESIVNFSPNFEHYIDTQGLEVIKTRRLLGGLIRIYIARKSL